MLPVVQPNPSAAPPKISRRGLGRDFARGIVDEPLTRDGWEIGLPFPMNDGTLLTTQWMECTKVTQKPYRFDPIIHAKRREVRFSSGDCAYVEVLERARYSEENDA